jgi:type I restriction enzyme R subunit
VAETIENNVRSKIVKDHLTDPAYFARMSTLLDEIIRKRREQAISYEEYLGQMADLAARVQVGKAEDTPAVLDTAGRRALYNNLKGYDPRSKVADPPAEYGGKDNALELALKIDTEIRRVRPDGWRGNVPKENTIKQALWGILHDDAEVERIFLIIRAQPEY